MKNKGGGRAARNKGARAEAELVKILTEFGIPSIRVLGSGAWEGAKSDLKVGVRLNEDGTMPDKDEAVPVLRAEVKNRKSNPEWVYDKFNNDAFAMVSSTRAAPEYLFEYLTQDAISKCVMLKRSKTPKGSLKDKSYNDTHLVVMGLEDWMHLLKELYDLRSKR